MNENEREKLPPPQDCRLCTHCTKYITQGVERHLCEIGKPMHQRRPWFQLRRIGNETAS